MTLAQFGISASTLTTQANSMDRTSQRFFCLSALVTPIGQAEWTTPGTFSWVCPAGVNSVSAVAIGAGSSSINGEAAGGGLGWRTTIPTIPGTSYTVQVGSPTTGTGHSFFITEATVCGRKGATVGGTFVGDGGGNGGDGGVSAGSPGYGAGGGGAGGYAGKGGNGGNCVPMPPVSGTTQDGSPGQNGVGGGGGGGGGGYAAIPQPGSGGRWAGAGGGGVGIYGQGSNGTGGAGGNNTGSGTNGKFGTAGSSGANGTNGFNGVPLGGRTGGNGGTYGGGAGQGGALIYYSGSADFSPPGNAQGGAVRIIWGQGRFYPSTRTANE